MVEIAAALSIIGTLANVGLDIVRYSNNVKNRKMSFGERLINFFGMSNTMPVNNNYPYAVPVTMYPQPWIPQQPIGIVGTNPMMDSRRFQNNVFPLWDERNENNMMYGSNYAQRQYCGYTNYPYGMDNNYNYCGGYNQYPRHCYDCYGYDSNGNYVKLYDNYGYGTNNMSYGYGRHCYDNYGYDCNGNYVNLYNNNYGYGRHCYDNYGYGRHCYDNYGYDSNGNYVNLYDNYGYGNTGYNSIAYPYGDNSNNNSQDYWFNPTYGMTPAQEQMMYNQNQYYDPYMVSAPQYQTTGNPWNNLMIPTQTPNQFNMPVVNGQIDYGYNTPRYQNGRINNGPKRYNGNNNPFDPNAAAVRMRQAVAQEVAKFRNHALVQPNPQRPQTPRFNPNQMNGSLDSFFEDSAWSTMPAKVEHDKWDVPTNFGDNLGGFESNPGSAFDSNNSIKPQIDVTPITETQINNSPNVDDNGPSYNGISFAAMFNNARTIPEGPVEDLHTTGTPIATDPATGRRYLSGYYPDGIPESAYIDKDPNSVGSVIENSPAMPNDVVSMFADPNGNPLS
jgi:hypothetical protein